MSTALGRYVRQHGHLRSDKAISQPMQTPCPLVQRTKYTHSSRHMTHVHISRIFVLMTHSCCTILRFQCDCITRASYSPILFEKRSTIFFYHRFLQQKKMSFQTRFTLKERRQEIQRIRQAHPNRVAVIVEAGNMSAPALDRHKFLVPKDITVGQFLSVIRKRMTIDATQSIFLFQTNQTLLSPQTVVCQIPQDEDGFIYIRYSLENTFGCWKKKMLSQM